MLQFNQNSTETLLGIVQFGEQGQKAAAASARSELMRLSHGDIGQKVAQAVRTFEKSRTNYGRKWVAVFLNEETIAIALHGFLTIAEKSQAQCPAGAVQLQEYHRQLFMHYSDSLLQRIKSITGLQVRSMTAEIDLARNSVIQMFMTDTIGEEFPIDPDGPAVTRPLSQGSLGRQGYPASRAANKNRVGYPEMIDRV